MMLGQILRFFAGAALLLLSVCFSRIPVAGNDQAKWLLVIGLSIEQHEDTWIIAVCDKDVFDYINQMAKNSCLLKLKTHPQNTYIRTAVDLSSYAFIPASLERILVLTAASCSEFTTQFDCKYTNIYGEISVFRGNAEHRFIIRPDNQANSDTVNAGLFVRNSSENFRWYRVWRQIKKKVSTNLCACVKSNAEGEDDTEESEVRIADLCRRLSVMSQGSEKTICWSLGRETPPPGYYQQQQAMERRRIRDQANRQLICQSSCRRYEDFRLDSCSLTSSTRTVTQPLEVEAPPFKPLVSQCSSDSGYSSKGEYVEDSASLISERTEECSEPYSLDEDVVSPEYLSHITLPVMSGPAVSDGYLYSATMQVFRNELPESINATPLSFSDIDSLGCLFHDSEQSMLHEQRSPLPILNTPNMIGDYLANPALSAFQNFLQERRSPTPLSFSDAALSLTDVDSLGSTFLEPEKLPASGSVITGLERTECDLW